jgi:hypothetical protein
MINRSIIKCSEDPSEWHLVRDKDGWFIENQYGEEVAGTPHSPFRCDDPKVAQAILNDLVNEQMDNYEPCY